MPVTFQSEHAKVKGIKRLSACSETSTFELRNRVRFGPVVFTGYGSFPLSFLCWVP